MLAVRGRRLEQQPHPVRPSLDERLIVEGLDDDVAAIHVVVGWCMVVSLMGYVEWSADTFETVRIRRRGGGGSKCELTSVDTAHLVRVFPSVNSGPLK